MASEEAIEVAAEAVMAAFPGMTDDYVPAFFRKLAAVALDSVARRTEDGDLCAGCDKPPPAEWCWNGYITGCPSGMPPKYLDVTSLWRLVCDQQRRIEKLENP